MKWLGVYHLWEGERLLNKVVYKDAPLWGAQTLRLFYTIFDSKREPFHILSSGNTVILDLLATFLQEQLKFIYNFYDSAIKFLNLFKIF